MAIVSQQVSSRSIHPPWPSFDTAPCPISNELLLLGRESSSQSRANNHNFDEEIQPDVELFWNHNNNSSSSRSATTLTPDYFHPQEHSHHQHHDPRLAHHNNLNGNNNSSNNNNNENESRTMMGNSERGYYWQPFSNNSAWWTSHPHHNYQHYYYSFNHGNPNNGYYYGTTPPSTTTTLLPDGTRIYDEYHRGTAPDGSDTTTTDCCWLEIPTVDVAGGDEGGYNYFRAAFSTSSFNSEANNNNGNIMSETMVPEFHSAWPLYDPYYGPPFEVDLDDWIECDLPPSPSSDTVDSTITDDKESLSSCSHSPTTTGPSLIEFLEDKNSRSLEEHFETCCWPICLCVSESVVKAFEDMLTEFYPGYESIFLSNTQNQNNHSRP